MQHLSCRRYAHDDCMQHCVSAATERPACRLMAASLLYVQDQDADQPRDAAGDTAVEDAPEAK